MAIEHDIGLLIKMMSQIGSQMGAFDYFVVDTILVRPYENEDGTITLVCNLYPKWQGNFGQAACATVYLNDDRDKKRLAFYCGRDPDQFVVADVTQPPMRKPGSSYPWENKVNPFGVLLAPQEQEGTKKKKRWVLYWHKLESRQSAGIRSAESDPPKPIPPKESPRNGATSTPASPPPPPMPEEPDGFADFWGDGNDRAEAADSQQAVAEYFWQDAFDELVNNGDLLLIKTQRQADWLGQQLFGDEYKAPRADHLYRDALMMYDLKAKERLDFDISEGKEEREARREAHDSGLKAVEFMMLAGEYD